MDTKEQKFVVTETTEPTQSPLTLSVKAVGDVIDSDDTLTKFMTERFSKTLVAVEEVQKIRTKSGRFGQTVTTLSPHFEEGISYIFETLNDVIFQIPKTYSDEHFVIHNAFRTLLEFVKNAKGIKREEAKRFIFPDFYHPNAMNQLLLVY